MTRYITRDTILPPYMIFPRFLLDARLNGTEMRVYVILLDRTRMSMVGDRWKDSQGNVFLVYPVEELAETLNVTPRCVENALAALERNGWIARARQGIGRANRIYLKIPEDPSHEKESSSLMGTIFPVNGEEPCASHGKGSSPLMGRNLHGNKNNREKTNEQKQWSEKGKIGYGPYGNVYLSEGEYDRLSRDYPNLAAMIEKMSLYLKANGKTYQDYGAALRAWAEREPRLYSSYECEEDESL